MIDVPPPRRVDLVAKLSGVNLKDTLRVLIAARAVAQGLGESEAQIVTAAFASLSEQKPTPSEVGLCERAYYELKALSKTNSEIRCIMRRLGQ